MSVLMKQIGGTRWIHEKESLLLSFRPLSSSTSCLIRLCRTVSGRVNAKLASTRALPSTACRTEPSQQIVCMYVDLNRLFGLCERGYSAVTDKAPRGELMCVNSDWIFTTVIKLISGQKNRNMFRDIPLQSEFYSKSFGRMGNRPTC